MGWASFATLTTAFLAAFGMSLAGTPFWSYPLLRANKFQSG